MINYFFNTHGFDKVAIYCWYKWQMLMLVKPECRHWWSRCLLLILVLINKLFGLILASMNKLSLWLHACWNWRSSYLLLILVWRKPYPIIGMVLMKKYLLLVITGIDEVVFYCWYCCWWNSSSSLVPTNVVVYWLSICLQQDIIGIDERGMKGLILLVLVSTNVSVYCRYWYWWSPGDEVAIYCCLLLILVSTK